MLGTLGDIPSTVPTSLGAPFTPALIMALCVVAGVGTVLLLPAKRDASIRKIGGIILLAAGLILSSLLVRWTANSARGGMGFYFWLFSAIAIGGAIRVITHTKPVYSALYFVLTVFATAGLFLLLWAEFMAIALVLIYAGAILVTYVFVIMLASEAASTDEGAEHDIVSRDPVGACIVGFLLMGVLLSLVFDKFQIHSANANAAALVQVNGTTQMLGTYLFKNQVVSLELAGLILTIAMVGAIMIARKHVIVFDETARDVKPEVVMTPNTPVNDNPHSIPVEGTLNPRQKAWPET